MKNVGAELNKDVPEREAVRGLALDRRAAHRKESKIGYVNEEIEKLIRKQKEEFKCDYERAKQPFSGVKIMQNADAPSIAGGDVDDTLDCDEFDI